MPEPHTSTEPPVDPGAHPSGSGTAARGERAARDETPSVAREAARLLEVLSAQGYGRPAPHPATQGSTHAADGAATSTTAGDAPASGYTADHAAEHAIDHGADHGSEQSTADGDHECTCGGRAPAACAVCPVCQVVSLVQRVSPETIDRLADFAAFAADALRDVAERRRSPKETP